MNLFYDFIKSFNILNNNINLFYNNIDLLNLLFYYSARANLLQKLLKTN